LNIQIGPGGVQFGAGTTQPGSPGNHNHSGHNHSGHNHSGHNHSGHNHSGHNHPNHNWNNWNRTPPVVVQPQPQTVLRIPGLTTTPAAPSPPAEPILLVNPAETRAPVQYRVNQYSYVLQPGSTQQLDGYRAWTIDYDRGSNYGRQSYGLTPGRTYRFAPGPRGWELYVVQPDAQPPSLLPSLPSLPALN
jgi:hypothetical protein